jgi:putative membrane protein
MFGYGHDWGMMGGSFGGAGGFNMVFWVLALLLLAGGVFWFMRSSPSIGLGRNAAAARPGGLDVLEQRYARGEVNREEYLQKKGDLQA